MNQRTLLLLKPEALEKGHSDAILERFLNKGFLIVQKKELTPTLEQAQSHYSPHEGKPFYERITKSLSRGPIIAVVLEGVNVIQESRKLIGATDPVKAEPGTIRKDFAEKMEENMIHGSDSPDEAEREMKVWFS